MWTWLLPRQWSGPTGRHCNAMWNRVEIPMIPTTGVTASNRTGDDGYYRHGRPLAHRRVAMGDGTVYDRATGLWWAANPTTLGAAFYTAGALVQFNWAAAVDACEGLTYAGFADWYLPNLIELLSLLDLSRTSAPMADALITGLAAGYHWTSTPQTQAATTYAHVVSMATAYVATTAALKSTGTYYALPCRGGRRNG